MSDIKKVERDGDTTRTFYEDGESVVIHSSEEAAEQYEKAVKAEIAKWASVVKASGAKVD